MCFECYDMQANKVTLLALLVMKRTIPKFALDHESGCKKLVSTVPEEDKI